MNTNTTLSKWSWLQLNEHRVAPTTVLSLLLLLTLPAAVQAQFTYTTTNGTITITGYTGPGGPVTIPSVINGLPVTTIGVSAFYELYNITSATIPTSVTCIKQGAFYGCTGLTNVTIGNSVTNIGDYAFASCSMTSVTIPASVTTIGKGPLVSCTNLTAITVEALNSAYSSVEGVLFNKSQATLIQCPGGKAGSYTVPGSVTSIGDWAFDGCLSLSNAMIPNSVTNIGWGAFEHCGLISLMIPNSITSIGIEAFCACLSLTNVMIPNSVTNIGQEAFYECTRLTSVTIPASVNSIGMSALACCYNLTELYFKGNAPTPDVGAFDSDNNAIVYYLPGTTGWGSTFGGLPTALWQPAQPEAWTLSASTITTTSATLNGTVNPNGSVTAAWFQWGTTTNYGNLTPATGMGSGTNALPFSAPLAGLTPGTTYHFCAAASNAYGSAYGSDQSFTPESAAAHFTYVTNNGTIIITGYTGQGGAVTIPDTVNGCPVTSIGDYAFDGCLSLTSVTIPNSIVSIGDYAFLECSSLTSVTIPTSVTYIGVEAFGECASLSAITVDALNAFYSSVAGVLFNKNQTTLVVCPGGKAGSYTIPSSVTGIGDGAFYYCRSLVEVTIPNSVTRIGDYAFYYCDRLTSATIPNSVTRIADYAFYNCQSLTSVTIPERVTSIGAYAFYVCCSLTSVTIPNSATNIGDWAFYLCLNVTNVTIGNSVSHIGWCAFRTCSNLINITIPSSVTSIGPLAFETCTSLTSVSIPNRVTSIGYWAFSSCTSLTDITIPDSVTSIEDATFGNCTNLTSVTIGNSVINVGQSAFKWCASLTNVTIPKSVTNIQDYAFYTCTKLTGVYFQGNAPSLGSYVFDGDNNATIYYLPGTTGWGATFGGRPTMLWIQVPAIQTSPQNQTAEATSVVGLRVTASSPLPLFYFWYLNATNLISSSTNSQLELSNVQFAQSGAYTVVISNVLGAVTSAPAMLNVIAAVERRPVPGVKVTGESASYLHVDYANSSSPAPNWTPLGSVSLTGTSQYCFDLALPLPPQRFYRAWQTGTPAVSSSLDLHLVPAITLTGNIGGSVRLDYINQFGPTDAWVTLATVPLTNTSQLYFDISAPGQPPRLWRIVPGP